MFVTTVAQNKEGQTNDKFAEKGKKENLHPI